MQENAIDGDDNDFEFTFAQESIDVNYVCAVCSAKSNETTKRI